MTAAKTLAFESPLIKWNCFLLTPAKCCKLCPQIWIYPLLYWRYTAISRKFVGKKMCTQQSRKVIWDMINTLFLTVSLFNLLSLLSFSIRKHTSMASCVILSNFFEEQRTQNHPQYLSGLSRALFPTTVLEIAVYGCYIEF